jgi:hypothetical protein
MRSVGAMGLLHRCLSVLVDLAQASCPRSKQGSLKAYLLRSAD